MEKHSITISKATLSHGLFLKVSYEEHLPGNSTRNYPGMSSTDPVHADLTNAFKQLPAHLALICEEISNEDFIKSLPEDNEHREAFIVEMGEEVPAIAAKKIKGKKAPSIPYINAILEADELAVDKFSCDSITIKGHGGSIDTVSLSGYKTLSNFKSMGISSPMTKLIIDEYKYAEDLSLIVEAIKFEIHEFLFNGKKAPDQPDLFSDGIGLEEHTLKTNAYRDPTQSISSLDTDDYTVTAEPSYESEVISDSSFTIRPAIMEEDDDIIPEGGDFEPGGDLDLPADDDSY